MADEIKETSKAPKRKIKRLPIIIAAVVVVAVMSGIEHHVKVAGAEARLGHARDLHAVAPKRQARERGAELRRWRGLTAKN